MGGLPMWMKGVPQQEHWEINDDGRQYKHDGYTIDTCVKCGGEFLIAKAMKGKIRTCGSYACDSGK